MDLIQVQWVWLTTRKKTVRNFYMAIYPPPFTGQLPQRGHYIGTYDPTNSSFAPTADTIYYVPIIIPYQIVLDLIGVKVDVAEANKNCKLGIYPIERGYLKDIILQTDEISLGTNDFKSEAIEVVLSPGAYVFAFVTDATGTAEIREVGVNVSLLPEPATAASAIYPYYAESLAYASCLPVTPGTLTLTQGSCPRILARVSA